MMTEKAKAARAAYMREYRKKHPEKIAVHMARYWEKKARRLDFENTFGKEDLENEHI